jgi:hypothetical protein
MAKGKKRNLLKPTKTTNIAAKAAGTIGKTAKGRDSLTRVSDPVKVVDTHARQWNRWSP